MSEQNLLEQLKKSNVQSYEKLIDTYSTYIVTIVQRVGRTLTKEDIEEVTADVFIKIWQYRASLDIKEGYLKSYLAKMARNMTLNKLRSQGKVDYLPLEEDEITYDTPEKKLLNKEEGQVITQLVETLPEPDREIFIRRYFYCEKLASISDQVDIPLGTVGTKIARAKKRLQEALSGRGIFHG